ncbi:MAG: DUF169 domain-containing protein [Bryobacteraceae bacterium]
MRLNSEIADSLTRDLHLSQSPVAVCLTDSVPEGVEGWSGRAPAGCRFWEEAANRVFATSAGDHGFCAVGQYTHNLDATPVTSADLKDALKIFADLTYVREQDLQAIPVLATKSKHVIYGPLAQVPLDPDVVLLFVRADQSLILSEAARQLEDGFPPAMGRPACAIVPQAVNTGRSALSLGCCGARAYLDVLSGDVALYAIPGAVLTQFAERITALSNANEILTKFHRMRRQDIEAGANPTVRDSLIVLQSAG